MTDEGSPSRRNALTACLTVALGSAVTIRVSSGTAASALIVISALVAADRARPSATESIPTSSGVASVAPMRPRYRAATRRMSGSRSAATRYSTFPFCFAICEFADALIDGFRHGRAIGH